ncbi:helix-turn-helix domain-containing protein [bacterium]|nr:helix-turn-helix domain-containing protein [bacterium]
MTNQVQIQLLYSGQKFLWIFILTIFTAVIANTYLYLTYRLDSLFQSFDMRKRPGVTGIALLLGTVLISTIGFSFFSIPLIIHLTFILQTLFSIGLIIMFAIHFRYPEHAESWILEIKKVATKRMYLNEIDITKTERNLLLLMTNEKVYRDNELSLTKLASKLKISKYQLSQLLNLRLNTSFHNFIRRYRIKEAKLLIAKNSNRTLLSIAYEVGFNSVASFQTGFKKEEKKTPSEFRQSLPLST